MIVAKIKVDGVSAKTAYLSDIPAGIIGAQVEIEYTDAMWSDLSKTVVFRGCCTKDVTNAGTSVIIPADVVAKPGARIMVGVYGVDADNNLAIPTLWAPLGVTLRAADPSGDESTDPSLPVWAQLDSRVSDLEKNQVAVDKTLEVSGNAADAAAVGAALKARVKTVNGAAPDENGNVNVEGVSSEEKKLILSLFQKAAYTADVSETFAQLSELWGIEAPEEPDVPEEPDEPEEPDVPVVTLTSISATYSGGDVPVGTAVTDLTGIVVTAHYSDGSTETVTEYTMSGTIVEGNNTVTVTYIDMATTFTVTGVTESSGEDEPDEPVVEYETVRTLSADNLEIGTNTAYPSYFSSSNTTRLSYNKFDIPVLSGYVYKFDFVSTADTAQIGTQFYNERLLENVSNSVSYNSADLYDPGWQENGCEVEVPELINDSPIAGVRLAFRKDTINSAVYDGMIESVTITRKAVG